MHSSVRRRALAAVALAGLLAASGCASDASSDGVIAANWYADTEPADVLATAAEAMAVPTSVRVQQQAQAPGGTIAKDLLVSDDGDCTGRLQLPAWNEPADLVVLDGDGAFRGTSTFWSTVDLDLGGRPEDAVRAELVDTYAETWTTTPGLDTLCALDDYLRPLGTAADGDLEKGGVDDVDGEPAGLVVSDDDGTTVTVWVALAEPHRVLRIVVTRGEGGTGDTETAFSDFGTAVEVDFPGSDDVVTFAPPATAPE